MLNRLSPRSRISMISFLRVSGSALSLNGNPSSPTEPTSPGTDVFGAATVSAREPRATTPSGGCRFAPSSYACKRGLSCMSWRQAETRKTARQRTRPDIFNILFYIAHLYRSQALEDGAKLGPAVVRVVRFDAQEEAILRGAGEIRRVEGRVIRLRQPAHQQIADEGAERRQQHRAFKRDRNKRRQAQQRTPADVERIGDGRSPVLQRKSAQRAEDAADQRAQRHVIPVVADGLRKPFDRKWRIGVDPAITHLVCSTRRRDDRARRVELSHQAVKLIAFRPRQRTISKQFFLCSHKPNLVALVNLLITVRHNCFLFIGLRRVSGAFFRRVSGALNLAVGFNPRDGWRTSPRRVSDG